MKNNTFSPSIAVGKGVSLGFAEGVMKLGGADRIVIALINKKKSIFFAFEVNLLRYHKPIIENGST